MPSERKVGAATSEADRDRLLAELQQRALALETEVRRNRALAEEARAAVHQRDEVLSIASHELKTPLASLQILVQGLLRMNPAKTREPVEKALAKASARLNLLGVLVDDCSTPRSSPPSPSPSSVRRFSLAQSRAGWSLASSSPRRRRGRCSGSSFRTDSVGHWDRRRLEQVLGHLLTNGMARGGSTVHVVVERTDDAARILVREHRPGSPSRTSSESSTASSGMRRPAARRGRPLALALARDRRGPRRHPHRAKRARRRGDVRRLAPARRAGVGSYSVRQAYHLPGVGIQKRTSGFKPAARCGPLPERLCLSEPP